MLKIEGICDYKNFKIQSFDSYVENRSLVGRFDDSDLTQRPAILPRTDAGGEIFRAVEAVTALQQHYDEEVIYIRLVVKCSYCVYKSPLVCSVQFVNMNGPWSESHKTLDGTGKSILYGLSKEKGKQLKLGNKCLAWKLGFVTQVSKSPTSPRGICSPIFENRHEKKCIILIKIQAERQLKEVDRLTEKSRVLTQLKLAWLVGFQTQILNRHAIVYTSNPAHVELLFSEASVQRGK